ncbi:MAG: aminotransferase class IV [Dehalococcoidia bacterium]
MEEIVYLNGALVPRQEARISPLDRGFLYGYGLFETMRAYEGRIFRLERHLARLMRSAEKLGFAPELDPYELEQSIYQTLKANRLANARIRLTVTAGEGEMAPDPSVPKEPTVLIMATSYAPYPRQKYEEGFKAVISSICLNSQSPLSRTKSTNYLNNILAKREASAAAVDEALMLNERGFLAEGSASNLFLVVAGRLITPSEESGILPGIAREAVLELAQALAIEAVEGELPSADLLRAEEAFLTNSVMEVMPLSEVDGKPIGSGGPGAVTKRLMAAYRELADRETQ